jgi:hypothetical protein
VKEIDNAGGSYPGISPGVLIGVPQFIQRELDQASELGLVARWSREFGYISIHDPTTGEWHDVSSKDAPGWVKREAHKRKTLRRLEGITRTLTAEEMEEIWKKEKAPMWDEPGCAPTPVSTGRRYIYEDYLDEE